MNIALIFAGGTGTRMKSKGLPKQFLEVHGKTILAYTIEHFEQHPEIDAILVGCLEEYIDYTKSIIKKHGFEKVRWIIPGGATPLETQYLGMKTIEKDLGRDNHIVLLHDGVRPLIDSKLISDCIASVKEFGSAVTMSPAVETIITVDENNIVDKTINRKNCRLGRAPQCFFLKDILAAHEQAIKDDLRDKPGMFIDSATLLQYYGFKIRVIEGPVENIKITTPMDFYVFKALLDVKENSQIFGIE